METNEHEHYIIESRQLSVSSIRPGTVKGTARMSACDLRPGNTVRLCGPKAKYSSYSDDSVPRPEEHMNTETWRAFRAEAEIRGDRTIEKIETYVSRQEYARRGSRYYRIFWVEGGYSVLSASSRHDVYAKDRELRSEADRNG